MPQPLTRILPKMQVAVAWLKPHHREVHLSGDRVLPSQLRPDSSSEIEDNHSKNNVGSTTKQMLWLVLPNLSVQLMAMLAIELLPRWARLRHRPKHRPG